MALLMPFRTDCSHVEPVACVSTLCTMFCADIGAFLFIFCSKPASAENEAFREFSAWHPDALPKRVQRKTAKILEVAYSRRSNMASR
jgi:hypothetical protein